MKPSIRKNNLSFLKEQQAAKFSYVCFYLLSCFKFTAAEGGSDKSSKAKELSREFKPRKSVRDLTKNSVANL
jgi:hypothetical protein